MSWFKREKPDVETIPWHFCTNCEHWEANVDGATLRVTKTHWQVVVDGIYISHYSETTYYQGDMEFGKMQAEDAYYRWMGLL